MSVQDVNNSEFEVALENERPLFVDFWAPWCGPCRQVSPVVDEIARSREDVQFVKVNVDNNQELANRFEIKGIPTLIIFKGGQEIKRVVGAHGKQSIISALDSALAPSH
jgi:thioredoxin 1